MSMRVSPGSFLFAGIYVLFPVAALSAPIQPGSPAATNTLPSQMTGAPAALVFAQEDPEIGPVISLGGSFTSPVNLGDVVLCEGAAAADHTGCIGGAVVSDVLRFTYNPRVPPGPIYQYQLFSDPDTPEGGVDLTQLPGGGLLAQPYYISETATIVDTSAFGGPVAFPLVVYKANDGMGNVNTYWIGSDAEAPEPSTWVLVVMGLGLVGASRRSGRRGSLPWHFR